MGPPSQLLLQPGAHPSDRPRRCGAKCLPWWPPAAAAAGRLPRVHERCGRHGVAPAWQHVPVGSSKAGPPAALGQHCQRPAVDGRRQREQAPPAPVACLRAKLAAASRHAARLGDYALARYKGRPFHGITWRLGSLAYHHILMLANGAVNVLGNFVPPPPPLLPPWLV